MLFIIYVALLCMSILVAVVIAGYTVAKSENKNSSWFIAMIVAIIIYLLGVLLGIFSPNKEAAFNGMRVEYFGAVFIGLFALFFVSDYCKIKIHAAIKVSMLLISASILVLLWTTECHLLIYSSYTFSELPLVGIVAKSGPLRPAHSVFTLLCIIAASVMIAIRLVTWDAKYRKRLSILLITIFIPAIANTIQANVLFFVRNGVNVAAISMIVMVIVLWFSVIKYNLFDIVSTAMKMAINFTSEAFVLIDTENNVLYSNESAAKIFPMLKTIKQGSTADSLQNWPFEKPKSGLTTAKTKFELPGERHFTASMDVIKDERSKILGYIILIQDISEVFFLAKAESRMKTELMTTISHEARTPLAVLSSYASLVAMELRDKGIEGQAAENLDIVISEAERVADLIDSMKRITLQGEGDAKKVCFDLGEAALQTARLYRHIFEARSVVFETVASDNLPTVYGCPEELTQVIFNLLQNSKNYTEQGKVSLTVTSENNAVTVKMTDTGSGIETSILPKIFERGVIGKDGGDGIGLALCKEIIEAHGGTITIHSSQGTMPYENSGTTVIFTLPVYGEKEMDQ